MSGSQPGPGAGQTPAGSANWVRVAALADVPPGSALEVRHDGRSYALFRLGESVYCLDGLCPHQKGRLTTVNPDESVVTCSRLGCLRWQFDIRTGSCLQQPQVRARAYGVRIEGDSVFLALDPSG
ncbi:Naphthalene 1,2-dioxygenase/salicylate 5-hydroxylase system, ferredoxin component [Aquisphaera giovannonii]|uniref:Naphthalene 1,2-dioxygenase/salicylate 5-hydroxylase system, ferredoxin component n=1 Tax=Aquisphaera giovannonii TaxID=406548 RepID=A0A5B9WEP4_9BACT|nr:Rieske 2Fe-2S domain-containing protein [Aquisphaera giovannonii]QEH39052.1 Naphthalene 1,2-dioxygenase/salicylate 5-hydroxylase system, ferredoxin component [Aquisphaera giovannonii]